MITQSGVIILALMHIIMFFLLVIDSEICLFCRQLKKFFFMNMPYLKLYTLLICEL